MCPIRISFWDTEELFQELFQDLFNEIKGFKYQITVKVLLIKYRINIDKEFAPVYFNSAPRTVINSEYMLDKFFQETLYVIDNWISEGSGRVIESKLLLLVFIHLLVVSTCSRAISIHLKVTSTRFH